MDPFAAQGVVSASSLRGPVDPELLSSTIPAAGEGAGAAIIEESFEIVFFFCQAGPTRLELLVADRPNATWIVMLMWF